MKINFLFAAAAVAALALSCKDATIVTTEEQQTATLCVNVSTPGTKALIASDNTDDMTFHNVQIFVYDKAGQLEKSSGILNYQDDIVLAVIPGSKTVWAVVNAPSALQAPESLEGFPLMSSALGDNTLTSLVMSGEASVDVVTSANVSITVKHIASKIIIDSITRSFVNEAYSEVPLEIKRIYMSNVAADCDFGCTGAGPSEWLCKQGVFDAEGSAASLLLDDGIDFDLPEGQAYETAHTFYVYPNPVTADSDAAEWSPRKTRLVIECVYNDQVCYYPVTISGGETSGTIDRNKVYHIRSLTLTRPGSTNPDSKEPEVSSLKDCTFSVEIADWEYETAYSETF